MAKPDPDDPAPSFVEVLEGRSGTQPPKQTAAAKLATLIARAHREADPGKRPILVKLPAKRSQ